MLAVVLDAKWDPKKGYKLTEFERKTRKARTGSEVWRFPQLKIEEVPEPQIKPGQVLIQVKVCGICGSDIHMSETKKDGYINYPGYTKFPNIPGHEFSGVIVKIGNGVKRLKVGDMVTADNMIWCGECTPCRNGFPNHCESLEEFGFTLNGAFAEYTAIDAKCCWKINRLKDTYGDEEKAYEAGALVEPTTVPYHGMCVRAGGFKPGAYVTVFGAGPIGLATIALAKAAGASKVIVFEISKKRLELAKKVGADYVFDPVELTKQGLSPHERILEITEGAGADMQVEAAGAPAQTINEMEKSLAIGGKIVQIGRAPGTTSMYLERLQVRGAQLFGSLGHAGHGTYPNIIRLMASRKIDMRRIITKKYKLRDAIHAITELSTKSEGKTIIKI